MTDKIIKLLALADSPNDHEAIAAFRAARKFMRSDNLDWHGVFKTSKHSYENVTLELTKLMKLKLQLQQECYAIKDEITKHEIYLADLQKKVSVSEGEKEGFFKSKHTPSQRDIDEAFEKIFDVIYRFSSKKNDFIESLKSQWLDKKWLSPKQILCLRDNFIKYTGFEPAW